MKKKIVLLLALAIVCISFLSGCQESNDKNNNGETVYQPKPNIQITDKTSRTGYEGIDYCLYIDVIVRNYGSTGNAYVWAEVNQDNNHYEKHQSVYLESGKSQSMTFRFCEFSYWSSDTSSYRVWVED